VIREQGVPTSEFRCIVNFSSRSEQAFVHAASVFTRLEISSHECSSAPGFNVSDVGKEGSSLECRYDVKASSTFEIMMDVRA
jgi:hypothetical protein